MGRRGEIEIDKDLSKIDVITLVQNEKSFEKYFLEMEIIKEVYMKTV